MSIKKELSFVLPNRPGTLGRIASALAARKVNLLALDASGGLEHNIVRLVPDDPAKAMTVLKKHKLEIGVGSVLCVKLADKPGAVARLTNTLGRAGINIEYLYATGGQSGGDALVVLRTSDNRKAHRLTATH